MEKQRLQKLLSQAGLGSRRQIEGWIQEGLIRVNGTIAHLGDGATARDKISFKGKPVMITCSQKQPIRIIMMHKVVGEICSRHDPEHPKTVFDRLPPLRVGRWVMIGRLDLNTSGLLLFTNDGAFANRMMHPRYQVEREYAVRIRGEVTDAILRQLRKGVLLEGQIAQFKSLECRGGDGQNVCYHVTLTEGKNREVRRLWESQGLEVSRLMRVRYGSVAMPKWLSRGAVHELSSDEVQQVLKNFNQ